MKAKEEVLWFQKYRPINLESYIGNDELKIYLSECIKSNNIENLIFHGKPGGGKTTAAKIIMNNLNCDSLYLNASDENGIDTVRNKITAFATVASFKPLKIVVLDDCHGLTTLAQQALLNLIETTSRSTRFIFTTNSIGKLIPALQSRCKKFGVIPPSKLKVAELVDDILEKESISYNVDDLVTIVNRYFPDIRQIINEIQGSSKTGIFILDNGISNQDYLDEIISQLKSKKKDTWSFIRQIIANTGLNDFTDVYRYLYEKVSEFASNSPGEASLIIAEAEYQSSFVPDREITFMACIHRLLNIIK